MLVQYKPLIFKVCVWESSLILELTLLQFELGMLSKIKLKVVKGSCEFPV